MAANDYYGGFNPQHTTPHDTHPPPSPTWTRPPASSSPNPYAGYGDPYDHRNSQYTLASEHDYAGAGGRLHGTDAYADDIPLKPNSQQPQLQPARPDWADTDTHYPPSPNDQQAVPLNPSADRRRKKGLGSKLFKRKIPWVTYVVSIVQIAVFIAELVKSSQLTGSPIMTKPSFNPMIGPSPYVQINMGARFVACMRNTKDVQDSKQEIGWPCPSTTSSDPQDPSNKCTLSDLCGFGGVPNPKVGGSLDDKPEPDQWFRFIVPNFLHAGFIHIGCNMLGQLTMGADMEREIGWWKYFIVYFASGIFGFVLGGNLAAPGIASTGASGALFGILALAVLDLLYTWKSRKNPVLELIVMVITVLISFALGLLPGLDNFCHIGGFLTGLVLGIVLMRSPQPLRERLGGGSSYLAMSGGIAPSDEDKKQFNFKQPVGFFKGRKPLWWAWWIIRAGALVGIIVAFIVLLNNFYTHHSVTCSWCKYLSCLPVKNWCDVGKLTTGTSGGNTRRALLSSADSIYKGRAFY